MAIDYASLPGNPADVYGMFPGGLPPGFDWEQYKQAKRSQFNPGQYTNAGDRYRAWLEAGRPGWDAQGNPLSNTGSIVTGRFGPFRNPDESNPLLNQFAANRPWAQEYLKNGGSRYLLQQLGYITESDFNAYSSPDQQLIRQILQDNELTPAWMKTQSPGPTNTGVNPLSRPTGNPSIDGPSDVGTNPISNNRPSGNTFSGLNGLAGVGMNQVVPNATTTPTLGQVAQNTYNASNPVSSTLGNIAGRRRGGGVFRNRSPGGYQGY